MRHRWAREEDESPGHGGRAGPRPGLRPSRDARCSWKLGVPAYLLAGLVGVSRLEQDKHYLSDVVAGAALGTIVSRTVVRVNGRPIEGEPRRGAALRVTPILALHTRGVQLSVVF